MNIIYEVPRLEDSCERETCKHLMKYWSSFWIKLMSDVVLYHLCRGSRRLRPGMWGSPGQGASDTALAYSTVVEIQTRVVALRKVLAITC